ncbi:MAG: DUF3047 domain-containing protein [Lentisphaeraceae bacterium]|nr:DUF3047 domain-containing protein [Lentisphaeraceae bacterium]
MIKKLTYFAFITLFSLANLAISEESSANDPVDKNTIVVDYKDIDDAKIWEPKIKRGKARTKVYLDDKLKTKVLRVQSNQDSYYFQKSLSLDLSKIEKVQWQWKVTRHPAGGDVRRGSKDDQAAQILFAFEGRNLISYIWDPTAPKDYVKDASIPFIVSQKVFVIQSGSDKKDLNKWFSITRDVRADYKKLYGKEAPKLAGVAIQINSQHTESFCEAHISPITFIKK